MRSSLLAAAAAAALAVAPASAAPYSALYVFGDSLVDAGNAQIAAIAAGRADPAPAAAGYVNGRFTNGNNWADWLSVRLFGAPTVAALEGGTNFAFGGARAAANADAIPDLIAQVRLFGAASGGAADPNALYYLNFGGNDAFARTFGAADAPSLDAFRAAYTTAVTELVAFGARTIVIANVPDVGPAPIARGAGLQAAGTAQSALLNGALSDALAALTLPDDVRLLRFDAFGLGQEIAADPAAFGLPGLDQLTPCITTGTAPACPNLAYFDFVHPTTAVDRLFGDGLFATVPAPSMLALFGLGAAALLRRRPRN